MLNAVIDLARKTIAMARELALPRPRGAEPPGAQPSPVPSAGSAFELAREGDFWTIRSAEGVLRLKHSRGLETLHRLLTHPDQELHVTELAAVAGGRRQATDAGCLLDREARDAYRRRLEHLRAEVAEAESFSDPARAERARGEIEFLAAELSRAVGLGGRPRRACNPVERARVTVQKRVKAAIQKIQQGSPRLARYLSATVHTGTFCAYRPDIPNLTLLAPSGTAVTERPVVSVFAGGLALKGTPRPGAEPQWQDHGYLRSRHPQAR